MKDEEEEEGDFIDTEERVREVVATATSDVDIVEDRQLDSDEQDAVCSFVTATCGCG